MSASPKQQVPAEYEIRIGGHLDQHWSAWFDDLTVTHEADGTTKLCGRIADQAALYGVLAKVRDLGIVLIAVEAVDPATAVRPAAVS
ncbi:MULTISPECIES: hypothetical protein [unclassified Arthrobacter]|uniref:hypothetical protein n=1 Tax=unclassified Arthrobacter TaxID=235627 RepID=UPI0033924D82